MLIVCPSCATSYMIDPAAVPATGRMVRCARCKNTWFAGVQAPASAVGAGAENEPHANAPATGVTRVSVEPSSDSAADDTMSAPADTAPEGEPAAVADDTSGQPVEPAADTAGGATDDIPVTEAPPLVGPMTPARIGEGVTSGLDADEVEGFAARRERLRTRRENKRRSSRWTAIILVLVAFNVAVVGARNEVVRYLPQTASLFAAIGLPVNLRNLKFEDVKISKRPDNGVDTLFVDGTIVSTGNTPSEVPHLRFSLRNASGQEIYSWTASPARNALEPGERLPFHSHLASPPPDAVDVLVRFLTAQDVGAMKAR